ncbi:unnamed protein product [Didymodactylos carnosus]|uniref:Uncharacterized protein n=1 Tax=Didymodactylos carnosus TaxID=1234261 RepID=A0A815TH57_9BILA|nr:unnamed protein product [Didymodactylos carnosus]CAF1505963.1 unnamed protein product [Didymodactylos carnosus]CAF4191473.1 unnamed protein product [Didymodactylos carnosus]CAF4367165.1 unnamed protein product [Didymodactylos carnosus]
MSEKERYKPLDILNITNGTCYQYLTTCYQNQNPTMCLDWREICDEINECYPEREYRCQNGQCVDKSLFEYSRQPVCTDGSDSIKTALSFARPLLYCAEHICNGRKWSFSCNNGYYARLYPSIIESTCTNGRDLLFTQHILLQNNNYHLPDIKLFIIFIITIIYTITDTIF